MKILHMTPPIINNGIYRYIFTLLKYINKEQFEFSFLMQDPKALMQTKEYQEYKFDIKSYSTVPRENPEKFRKEIYEILSEGYDVLELHTSFWRGFMIEEIAMEVGIPKVIVHSHSSGIDCCDAIEREKLLIGHEQLKKEFNVNLATDFWACSKEAGEWLFGEHIPKEKIKYVHNAIEGKKYQFNTLIREKKRKELNLENSFVIGNTGRLEYQKNHEFLLRVFAKVKKHIANAKLLLVGEGVLRTYLETLCVELEISDSVQFLGWRNDVNELLQVMDIYALPSLFEGLSIVLIEAQASGLSCIVSDCTTAEAGITDNFKQLPLQIDEWVDGILKTHDECSDRRSYIAELNKAGFDISSEVNNIERLYLE